MHQRTQSILKTAIRDYIRTGKPVSSERLCDDYDFGVRSATIRAELNNLIDNGFLYQPHTSAGRVPTDKGYRFFVNQIMSDLDNVHVTVDRRLVNSFASETNELVDNIADELNLLGVGYETDEDDLYTAGLSDLFAHLDLIDKHDFFEVVNDFERLNERAADMLNHITNAGPSAFIGKSPITKSPHLAVVADKYHHRGREFMVMAIGPKRMNYGKVIKTLMVLHQYE